MAFSETGTFYMGTVVTPLNCAFEFLLHQDSPLGQGHISFSFHAWKSVDGCAGSWKKSVKSKWVVRGVYHSSEDVWMPKLSSTDTDSSGEIQPQGDVIFMCALPPPVDGLTPLLFHMYDSWFFSFTWPRLIMPKARWAHHWKILQLLRASCLTLSGSNPSKVWPCPAESEWWK